MCKRGMLILHFQAQQSITYKDVQARSIQRLLWREHSLIVNAQLPVHLAAEVPFREYFVP